ncbi:MAG: hypothetical protein N4A45_09530 [Flavobacteriales bacterium]|jgi:hypothetical protein|nr:hypothetical protein [Flavobacteriales bacterium]
MNFFKLLALFLLISNLAFALGGEISTTKTPDAKSSSDSYKESQEQIDNSPIDTAKLQETVNKIKTELEKINNSLRQIASKDTIIHEQVGKFSLNDSVYLYEFDYYDSNCNEMLDKSCDHIKKLRFKKWYNSLKYDQFTVCRRFKKTQTKIKIKSIEFEIKNGMAFNLTILTENNKEFRSQMPISIIEYRRHLNDRLFETKTSDTDSIAPYISLNDCLKYTKTLGVHTVPNNGIVRLDKDTMVKPVAFGTSLNSLLNVRIYTEPISLREHQPKGLIQSEIKFNFFSNTVPMRNSRLIWLHYLEPSLRFSKFENENQTLLIDSTIIETNEKGDKSISIDRSNLNLISRMDLGLKLNILTSYYYSQSLELSLIGKYGFSDILYKEEKYTVDILTFGLDLMYKIPIYKDHIGVDLGTNLWFQSLSEPSELSKLKDIEIENTNLRAYLIPQFEAYYKRPNTNEKLYVRFVWFKNFNEGEASFTQFQIGYKTSFSDWFGKK